MTTQLERSNVSENSAHLTLIDGWLQGIKHCRSPHFDHREPDASQHISLLVIHNISLPAGQFGLPYITDLFLGRLNLDAHPSFKDLAQVRVSAHCLIRRDGEIIQYVSFNDRAWHAGISCFNGKEKCNDYSIGIELEGTDDIPYTEQQYQQLSLLTNVLRVNYPKITDNIVGHCDIAPGRKTDPGEAFDWELYRQLIETRAC
ncbi:1,6-anhydro-N-acetylmuramyl-L-alanine amidase AmpD [Thalassotalea sp. G2M2-11]|uniref:1,6-anhydro-N-acetylmuramyl-L-alanine amidase AmpD n=1 Tax=Thalassotalea sp. G2M2-11 TaxID=2787627 RepID=UPI0019D2D68A|nr:1,6-anhydro-N-acetylmuramyl-L-alanine amidase AmpD [Thalassotalea sp. G2M2-11]